jgi:hypothetical protein
MKKTHEREKCVCHVVLRETFAMKNSLHLAFFILLWDNEYDTKRLDLVSSSYLINLFLPIYNKYII